MENSQKKKNWWSLFRQVYQKVLPNNNIVTTTWTTDNDPYLWMLEWNLD